MKKLLMFLFILALLVFPLMSVVRAAGSETQDLYTYSITNTANSVLSTNINATNATTGIEPGYNRVLGFDVSPITPGSGVVVAGLYDAATNATMNSTNLFGEAAGANNATASKTFIYPKPFKNGLSVQQGNQTTVVIYYEKKIMQ